MADDPSDLPVPWSEAIGWVRPRGKDRSDLIDIMVFIAAPGCFGDDRDLAVDTVDCENIATVASRLRFGWSRRTTTLASS